MEKAFAKALITLCVDEGRKQGVIKEGEVQELLDYLDEISDSGDAISGSSEIPNDLEEAAEEYRKRVCEHPMYFTYTKQCFIAGAKWQKEQMMKEAVEGEVIVPIYEGNDIWSAEIKIPGRYEVGDKVRIIICKKED